MSAWGHKQTTDLMSRVEDVRFTPKSGHRSGHSRLFAMAAARIGSLVTTLGNAQHIMLS
jgi:hypothetical protein